MQQRSEIERGIKVGRPRSKWAVDEAKDDGHGIMYCIVVRLLVANERRIRDSNSAWRRYEVYGRWG